MKSGGIFDDMNNGECEGANYPLIICNIFILFIAVSIKITIFANKIERYGKIH